MDDTINQVVTALRDALEFAVTPAQEKAMAYVKAIEIYDNFISQAMEKYPPEHDIVCASGCSHCCKNIRVAMYPSELFVLLHVSPFNIDQLKERARNGMQVICPFLEEDKCSIHEFKPIKCRGANSYDIEFCKNPPLIFSKKTAPQWTPAQHAASIVHQALGAIYGEKARPIHRIVEEYNG